MIAVSGVYQRSRYGRIWLNNLSILPNVEVLATKDGGDGLPDRLVVCLGGGRGGGEGISVYKAI